MTWHTKYNHLKTSELLAINVYGLSPEDLREYSLELQIRLEGARQWD